MAASPATIAAPARATQVVNSEEPVIIFANGERTATEQPSLRLYIFSRRPDQRPSQNESRVRLGFKAPESARPSLFSVSPPCRRRTCARTGVSPPCSLGPDCRRSRLPHRRSRDRDFAMSSPKRSAESGVCSAGLSTVAHPAAAQREPRAGVLREALDARLGGWARIRRRSNLAQHPLFLTGQKKPRAKIRMARGDR